MPRGSAAETLGGFQPVEDEKSQEEKGAKIIDFPGKETEQVETMIIKDEAERQKMFDDLNDKFMGDQIDYDEFQNRFKEIHQAETEDILVEITKISPSQYVELQDEIRDKFKDPKEQARKLAELDELTELAVEEEDKAKPEGEEYSLDNLIKNADASLENKNKATSTVLKEAAKIVDDDKIIFSEAQELVTDTFADKIDSDLREGRIDLAEGAGYLDVLKGNTEKLSSTVEAKKRELAKEAREQMNAGIDKAQEEGRLDFSSDDYDNDWQGTRDAAREIKSKFGVDVNKPGIFGTIKKFAIRVARPAEYNTHFGVYDNLRASYDSKSNQIEDKAPDALSNKPGEELVRAGLVKGEKAKEVPPVSGIEKLKHDLDSGKISLKDYKKITEATEKADKERQAKAAKQEEDIAIIKAVPDVMKRLDEMNAEGSIDISSADYQTAVHDMYKAENWLRENANYDPGASFFSNWRKARESAADMSEYKKQRKQYLDAKKRFDEFDAKIAETDISDELEDLIVTEEEEKKAA